MTTMDGRAFALLDAQRYTVTVEEVAVMTDQFNTDLRALQDKVIVAERAARVLGAVVQDLHRDRTELLDALRGADSHAADLGCRCGPNTGDEPFDPCPACSVRSYTDTSRWTQ